MIHPVPTLFRSHYRVDCTPGVMRVAFRERPGPDPISLTHEVQRTIGGREQAATVELTIERAEGAGKPFVEFRGVKLDPEHEYAIREGIVAACSRGCVKGYPLMDVAVTVTAVEHDEQASAGVLAHCAAETVRRGLGQANVQMLHPLMLVEVTVDDQCVSVPVVIFLAPPKSLALFFLRFPWTPPQHRTVLSVPSGATFL